jgi:Leucine-rich repeat (LRR) protein
MPRRAFSHALAALFTVLCTGVWGQPPAQTVRIPGVDRPVRADVTKLDISSSQVTDAEVKELAALKALTELSLADTQVTDVGVKDLTALKGLTKLNLGLTQVTDAGVKDLAARRG